MESLNLILFHAPLHIFTHGSFLELIEHDLIVSSIPTGGNFIFWWSLWKPLQWADPGFARGGGTNPLREGAKLLFGQKISQKLHENKRIWTQRGARPWRPPLRSANALDINIPQKCQILCYLPVFQQAPPLPPPPPTIRRDKIYLFFGNFQGLLSLISETPLAMAYWILKNEDQHLQMWLQKLHAFVTFTGGIR